MVNKNTEEEPLERHGIIFNSCCRKQVLGNKEHTEIVSIPQAVAAIDAQISASVSSLSHSRSGWKAVDFLLDNIEASDQPILKDLLEHPRREIQDIARNALLRVAPKDAEVYARSSFDWIRCAGYWKSAFENDSEAGRCLAVAESLAKDERDWGYSIDFRVRDFPDDDIRTHIKEKEAVLETTEGWVKWAKCWNELRGIGGLALHKGDGKECHVCR